MKRFTAIAAISAAAVAATAWSGAISEKTATTLKSSQTATLSWSSEEGAYVAFYKATLRRSSAYTVYTTGLTVADDVSLTVYPKDSTSDKKDEPSADFTDIDEFNGNIRQVMYADDWYIDEEDKSENDPKSWVYFFEFSATNQVSFEVNFVNGVSIPAGREDNPMSVSPTQNKTTVTRQLQNGGEFFVRARLLAGVLYEFTTVGGTEDKALTVEFAPEEKESESDSDSDDDDEKDYTVYDIASFADDPYNEGIYVIPETTGYYNLSIMGSSSESNSVEGADFTFTYRRYDNLAIGKHALAGTLSSGSAVEATAGRETKFAASGYYDGIIDESLYSFSAAKGERFVAETSGATVPLLIRIYDSKGNELVEGVSLDGETEDIRACFEASSAGTYYVGVCEDLEDPLNDDPSLSKVLLRLDKVVPEDGDADVWDSSDDTPQGATPLEVNPGTSASNPFETGAANGPHALSRKDWYDVFSISARKDLTYVLGVEFDSEDETSPLALSYKLFTLSGSTEKEVSSGDLTPGPSAVLTFTASANATYYLRLNTAETPGLDYPLYNVRAVAYSSSGDELGILKVVTHGTSLATFSIGSESVKYPGGSSVLLSGTQTVKFPAVAGFAAVASRTVKIEPGVEPTILEVWYSDTSDPKDDAEKGAVAWSLKNTETTMSRTLWETDPADNFSLTGADGYYYDIYLKDVEGDAVFSITNAETGVVADGVKSVSHILMPKTKAKYILTVSHGEETPVGGGYTLGGFFANAGSVKFAKTAVSAKENAASVAVQVQRTGKDGKVRVKYGTVAGSAVPGEDYIAQNGELVWEAGDNKPKTVSIKLIPDLVEYYEGNKSFAVRLEPLSAEEMQSTEYPAAIAGGNECVITLTEVSKAGTTVESAYAAKAPKAATVKSESVPLETGTFYGVMEEEGSALTNGLPRLASITFTASAATPAALSAKVLLAGKTYSFSAKGWDEYSETGEKTKTFELAQKVDGIVYTNTLSVTVREGATATDGDWLKSGGTAELEMNVPDANGKGVQENIRYSGDIFRNNAKIQGYFDVATNFTGYYTVSLVPDGVSVSDGIPSGNGYVTISVDNKGTAKVSGMLADGTTKPSASVAACAIVEDEYSSNGYAMLIPVFYAKSPVLFGGVVKLYANDEAGAVVADATKPLVWNNDNASVTQYGEDGYSIELVPCGGWFDTLVNLERRYLASELAISTLSMADVPDGVAASGYALVDDSAGEVDGTRVEVAANVFSTLKRALVKSGSVYDLTSSVNPCNVQVKLARATGLVSGSFVLVTANEAGTAMKDTAAFKHFGVLILACDPASPLDPETATAGFASQTIKTTEYNENTKRNVTRSWVFSVPFNINAVDQGDPDWTEDDWAE